MRITNSTQWRTDQIAALIRRVAKDELDPGQLSMARIAVKHQRANSRVLGRCRLGTAQSPNIRMTLNLPRPPSQIDSIQLAHTIAHELAHAKGLRHRDMKGPRYLQAPGSREKYGYAADFRIELMPQPKPLSKSDKAQAKLLHAEKMAGKWRTRVKRDTTILRKWERRLKAHATQMKKASELVIPANHSPPSEHLNKTRIYLGFRYQVYLNALRREDEGDEGALRAFVCGDLPAQEVEREFAEHQRRRHEYWAKLKELRKFSYLVSTVPSYCK